jgi:hypothetical protein
VKRGHFMLKKERDKLHKLMKTYIYIRGAYPDPTKFYEYKLMTKAGVLFISYSKDTGTIFCRFDDPEAALKVITGFSSRNRLNKYSGKWNYHFSPCEAETAFQMFKQELDTVL